MEEAGCFVGIGVATGADKVFVAPYATLDVEPDRKLPLVTTKDISSGVVRWQGSGVVNPFRDDGGLVNLRQYPKLAAYLGEHEELVRKRNVARNNPNNWYRTIDRINPELARKPKLLIPDIKGKAHVVFEDGKLYPHHNLYYITSEEWDLQALRAVLLSGIARLFVSTYSTKMRGGFLRFQAQYLRRIRIPRWGDVPSILRTELVRVAETGSVAERNTAVSRLYDASPHFPIFPEFRNASYAERYNVLCHKLVQEKLYTAATVLLSPRSAGESGEYSEMSELTGLRMFLTTLAGYVSAEAARSDVP